MRETAIIIEGPDGTGKSTFAAKLSEITGRKIAKFEGPPDNETADEIRVYHSIQSLHKPVIMDRAGMISSMVYAPILFNKVIIDSTIVAKIINEFRPTIFYCEKVFNNPKKDYEPTEYYEKILKMQSVIEEEYKQIMYQFARITNVIQIGG